MHRHIRTHRQRHSHIVIVIVIITDTFAVIIRITAQTIRKWSERQAKKPRISRVSTRGVNLLLEVPDGEVVGVGEEVVNVLALHVVLQVVHHVRAIPLHLSRTVSASPTINNLQDPDSSILL